MIKYRDFAITAFFNEHLNEKLLEKEYPTPEDRENYIVGVLDSLEKTHGFRLDYKESIEFFLKRREVYAHLTPYERLLDVILRDSERREGIYLPESRKYMKEINPELTEEEYQSGFQFWKDYHYHIKARGVVQGLSDMIGLDGIHINDGADDELKCIGFFGSPGNTPEVNELISLTRKFHKQTNNLLWIPPLLGYVVGDTHQAFRAIIEETDYDDEPELYLLTLAGSIYPQGKPRIKGKFSSHLSTVK